uniref:Myb/SANT-like DNA-binding domain-containing protein n=1 Tax=Oncorhynchus tshawytscha TaxID=74940 RepID=A0A8C8I3U0_ONCTS
MASSPILAKELCSSDTRRLIKLRAANEVLFTGRRNAAKAAWKAILKELVLLGKVSTYQVAKKWDNLKRRYKDLKYPPVGMESIADNAASWPWFYLMNEAMEGRLAASGPVLTPITEGDDPEPSPSQSSRNRGCPLLEKGDITLEYQQEIYVHPTIEECHRATAECESALREERLGRGPAGRWEMVERERAAIEGDRAAVDRERQWLESERANLARDRMLLEQDMAALGREREAFESQRAAENLQVDFIKSLSNPLHWLGQVLLSSWTWRSCSSTDCPA